MEDVSISTRSGRTMGILHCQIFVVLGGDIWLGVLTCSDEHLQVPPELPHPERFENRDHKFNGKGTDEYAQSI